MAPKGRKKGRREEEHLHMRSPLDQQKQLVAGPERESSPPTTCPNYPSVSPVVRARMGLLGVSRLKRARKQSSYFIQGQTLVWAQSESSLSRGTFGRCRNSHLNAS